MHSTTLISPLSQLVPEQPTHVLVYSGTPIRVGTWQDLKEYAQSVGSWSEPGETVHRLPVCFIRLEDFQSDKEWWYCPEALHLGVWRFKSNASRYGLHVRLNMSKQGRIFV